MPVDVNEILPRPQNWLVSHVPDDVWRMVFEICVAQYKKGVPRLRYRPLRDLCRICSVWRKLVVYAPELWSRISVYIHREPKDNEVHPELLDLFLERSRNLPLKISLHWDTARWADCQITPRACRTILQLLRNFHRADEIDIDTSVLYQPLHESQQEDILPIGVPLLRTLVLRTLKPKYTLDHRIRRIWALSPKLRSLTFATSRSFFVDYSLTANLLQIPFGQLSRIDIRFDIAARHIYAILSSFKNLVECIIRSYGSAIAWDERPEPLLLPALQRLSLITTKCQSDVTSFLQYVTTPALNALTLFDSGDHPPHDIFSSFVENSSCSIQDLSLNVLNFNPRRVLDFLSYLPHLSSLEVHTRNLYLPLETWPSPSGDVYRILIEILGQRDESSHELRLPRLRKLTVDHDIVHCPSCPDSKIFKDIVEARRISFHVSPNPWPPRNDFED